jgi:hypothetical protein
MVKRSARIKERSTLDVARANGKRIFVPRPAEINATRFAGADFITNAINGGTPMS